MKNNNEFHYIASGTSHLRVTSFREEEDIAWLNNQFVEMQKPDFCGFGLLYNAFTEKRNGVCINERFKDSLCDIHADSGGLQIMTVGATADDEQKNAIYAHQAKHSTIAMSFDEIPVARVGSRSTLSQATDRLYRFDMLEDCAKQSGINLAKQLKFFADSGSESKIMMIAQGNDQSTFNKWVEILQDQIPNELLEFIGGVAMSSASIGGGDLENIESAFTFSQLPLKFKCNQLHLLGVGAFQRLIPTVVFSENGVYKDTVISFDSTSHSGDLTRGTVRSAPGVRTDLPRWHDRSVYEKVFKGIREYDLGYDCANRFYEYFVPFNSLGRVQESSGHSVSEFLRTQFSVFRLSYESFLGEILQFTQAENRNEFLDKGFQMPIRALNAVTTQADYDAWKRQFSKYMRTKRVTNSKTGNLKGLFE